MGLGWVRPPATRPSVAFSSVTLSDSRAAGLPDLGASPPIDLRAVVNSPVGMAVTDPQGRYVLVNPAFCAMVGRREDELLGRHFLEVTPPADMPDADELRRRFSDGEMRVYQGENSYVHPVHGDIHMLVNSTAVHDDSGTTLYSFHLVQDITERRRMEEALRDSLERLRRSDAERKRLLHHLVTAQEEERARIAADVHDDSLQALAAVKMRLEMLTESLSDEQRSRLAAVERDLDSAATRLRRLLFRLRPSALDHGTLGYALDELATQLAEGRLATRVDDTLQATPAAATKVVVYRIVQEALVNVVKHARAGAIEVVLRDHEGGVRVAVHDDGIGFDYERARRTQVPGHLGLSIMSQRAEIAGGWLQVDTAPGLGTTVTCWVPRGDD
jgi:PAS domain S-box-containing protein